MSVDLIPGSNLSQVRAPFDGQQLAFHLDWYGLAGQLRDYGVEIGGELDEIGPKITKAIPDLTLSVESSSAKSMISTDGLFDKFYLEQYVRRILPQISPANVKFGTDAEKKKVCLAFKTMIAGLEFLSKEQNLVTTEKLNIFSGVLGVAANPALSAMNAVSGVDKKINNAHERILEQIKYLKSYFAKYNI